MCTLFPCLYKVSVALKTPLQGSWFAEDLGLESRRSCEMCVVDMQNIPSGVSGENVYVLSVILSRSIC